MLRLSRPASRCPLPSGQGALVLEASTQQRPGEDKEDVMNQGDGVLSLPLTASVSLGDTFHCALSSHFPRNRLVAFGVAV